MKRFLLACGLMASTVATAAENSFEAPGKVALEAAQPVDGEALYDIECFTEPGRQFCRDLRLFNNLLMDCRGAACYDLWNRQLNTIDAVEDWYYYSMTRGATVDPTIGSDVMVTARNLCAVRLTGDSRYIAALTVSYNTLLGIYEDMQVRAGVRFPYTCHFSVD